MRVSQATKEHVSTLPRNTKITKAAEMLRASKEEGFSVYTVILYLRHSGLDDVEIGSALDMAGLITSHSARRTA